MKDDAQLFEEVKDYYGKVLQTQTDLKTSACLCAGGPPPVIRDALKLVPAEVTDKFYGCGNPIPSGIRGLTVLDLGCGSGRDCYVAAQLVGREGRVIGVDMTEEQLAVARANVEPFAKRLGWVPRMDFVQGYIEKLDGIADVSIDLIISNCVVNLSPRKDLVLQAAYRVLKEGGELYFSDVYCDRRLPTEVQRHQVLWGECIAGALYSEDFKDVARASGFRDPRVVSVSEIDVAPEFKQVTGNARFYSITYRLFKLASLENRCEDYGQVAKYLGTIPGHEHSYTLDGGHKLITGKPLLVCGNTAAMLQESWLKSHFEVQGDRSVHYGIFPGCGDAATGSGQESGDVCCGVDRGGAAASTFQPSGCC